MMMTDAETQTVSVPQYGNSIPVKISSTSYKFYDIPQPRAFTEFVAVDGDSDPEADLSVEANRPIVEIHVIAEDQMYDEDDISDHPPGLLLPHGLLLTRRQYASMKAQRRVAKGRGDFPCRSIRSKSS
jgi:hypothetical protein